MVHTADGAYHVKSTHSVRNSHVPTQWKTARIRPVPKIAHPLVPSDYRPISVVPILSRVVERMMVYSYIYPALNQHPMADLINMAHSFSAENLTNSAANLVNSAAHRGKADEIPRLTAVTQLNFRGLIKS